MTDPKPDKSPAAQKLRQSMRYIQDIREQQSAASEVGDTLREKKLKNDLYRAQNAANEDADAYRASRKKS